MKKLFSAVMILALVFCASAAFADYPDKSIAAICPWGAGGGTDSRILQSS